MKRITRLSESSLNNIIKEAVRRVLKESVGVNEIIEEYGNPPYTAYFKYEGYWPPCNDPKQLTDYIYKVECHCSSTQNECGKAVIFNNEGEEIFSEG